MNKQQRRNEVNSDYARNEKGLGVGGTTGRAPLSEEHKAVRDEHRKASNAYIAGSISREEYKASLAKFNESRNAEDAR